MKPHYKATVFMMAAMLSFTFMAIAGRELSNRLDTFEIMMYRSLIGIPIVITFGIFFNTLAQIKFERLALHGLRNLFHFSGQTLWFFALTLIPLSQLFAFEFTTPLWVLILAPIFLNERLTVGRILIVCLGFLGIMFIVRPGTYSFNLGVIAASLCALGFAGTFLCTKTLTRTDSITCILFWLVVMQSIFGFISCFLDGHIELPRSNEMVWVLIISFTGLTAHYCIANALKLGSAMLIVPLDFLRLPLISLVGFLLYNESLAWQTALGSLLVFLANIFNIKIELNLRKS